MPDHDPPSPQHFHDVPQGRPRDFEDAVGVLVAQRGLLDEPYMADWARRLGLAEELAYLLGESGQS